MKSETELVAAAHESFLASFGKLAEHCPEGAIRVDDGVFAFVTGLPIAFFNGCVVTEPSSAAKLEAALGWVRDRGFSHQVWIAEPLLPELEEVPSRCGLTREPELFPGMILHPPPEPPPPPAGITILAGAQTSRGEFVGVNVEAGLPGEIAELLFPPSFASDPDVQLFVARLDGRPVGTAIAMCSPAAAGVYNVVTLRDARRRGVGTALTWAAVAAGLGWERDTIVLQSTAMGLRLYADLGFRTVAPYATFS